MAIVITDDRNYTNIASVIREKTNTENTYKPSEMPNAVKDVYKKGYNNGYTDGSMPIYYLSPYSLQWFREVEFPKDTELVISVKNPPNTYSMSFFSTKGLKSIKLITADKSIETYYDRCFRGSADLEIIDFSECACKCLDITYFVAGATKLRSIFGGLDLSNCKSTALAFYETFALEDISFVPNTIKISIDFHFCNLLTAKSIQSIIDGLADLTGGETQTITFHTTVGAKLTDEQKATITTKNWTLAY